MLHDQYDCTHQIKTSESHSLWWLYRGYIYVFIEKGPNCFSLISLKMRAKLKWSVRSLSSIWEENPACPVECPIVLVFWNNEIKGCLDTKYMEICVNSAILRDTSCLDTLNPSGKRVFEIKDGCKVASVNSHQHCTPAHSMWTTAGETKPNLKIYFIKVANCHHYNVL